MSLRNLKILGVIIAFILCFPLHFLYDKIPCFLTSIVAPVNESIMEHMKILFGSILLSGVIQKIIVKLNNLPFKNICISNVCVSFLSIPIFLILYLPIYYSFGEYLPLTILLMLITIIISQLISVIIIKKTDLHMENVAIILVIIIYVIFGILTYNPPKTDVFLDPISLKYGINEK